MGEPEFRYEQRVNGVFRAVVAGVLAAAAVVTVAPVLTGARSAWAVAGSVLVAVFSLGLTIWVAFMGILVTADAVGLRAGMRRWPSTSFSWSQVRDVHRDEVSVASTGGLGYRVVGRRSRAILARSGPGLRFELSKGRTVSVMCGDRSEELLQFAQERRQK